MAIPSTDWVAMGPIGTQPIGALLEASPAHPLGRRIRARDVTYGEVELIYLAGVASCDAGDLVSFDEGTGVTALAVKGVRKPLAVAIAAIGAGYYGWFAVAGAVPVNTGSGLPFLGPGHLSTTAGEVSDSFEEGERIDGLSIVSNASGGYATARLSNPTANGGEMDAQEEHG